MRTKPAPARRLLALLLAAVTLLGMMPALPVAAAETEVTRELREVRPGESWTMPYIEILVDWGIMRGDIEGNYDPEREISRAEYVTLLNRAFGYNDVSDNPFSDVHNDDWFYDDVCTAYNIGYLKGTSPTEASPHASLTREQGAVALGRNLMLEQTTGEVLNFVDSRDLGEWSRPLIRAVSDRGIISGYPDGTFQPFKRVTRGEVACMLVKAIGTPINQPGDYELGTVHGNLTVASSDVLLKNTTVTGDLYLTGGLGLGNVELRNVNVLGRIVASGAGESEKGDNSIVLTAVSADELLIDSIANQFVTLKADGSTKVDTTKVRTNAYIEDLTADGLGLAEIRVDGENGTALTLAGNVKNVTNYTPGSLIQVARGAAASVSVDEKATGANLQIDAGAVLKNANLDVSTTVSGAGDLAHVNINAADTTVTMLPDTVTIRPGLTASVGGREMDTMLAAESSDEPRLLAGFPKVQNIATSTAEALFSSNKNGTIYWATSALADGSVDEADLINPPKNAGYILQSGSIKADVSKNEYMAKLSKLTNDGSYYLSAIAVDERGRRSPVKVTAFQTPDDTKPDFLTDYPALRTLTLEEVWVAAMPNKDCILYYTLLPKSAAAPKPQDFKTGSISGNLGFGTREVRKNSTALIQVNRSMLREQEDYVLYLWLTDFDGAKSSSVEKLDFTTPDVTNPTMSLYVSDIKNNAVTLTFTISEPGTMHWAVVEKGKDFFQALSPGAPKPAPTDEAAKIQVESGVGALKSGSKGTSKGDTPTTFNVSGLKPESTYTLYYVAEDKSGNFAEAVEWMDINTLDNAPPTVTIEFTDYNVDNLNTPLPTTDIHLIFNEGIQYVDDAGGFHPFEELYNDVTSSYGDAAADARQRLATYLSECITMMQVTSTGVDTPVPVFTGELANSKKTDGTVPWVIDFRYAQVDLDDEGRMHIIFPTVEKEDGGVAETSALNLASGAQYYFELTGIHDVSTAANRMGNTTIPRPPFQTVSAQLVLSEGTLQFLDEKMVAPATWEEYFDNYASGEEKDLEQIRADVHFKVDPQATSREEDSSIWDMQIWLDTTASFHLFRREVTTKEDGTTNEADALWEYVKPDKLPERWPIKLTDGESDVKDFFGLSLYYNFLTSGNSVVYDKLNTLDENITYEYIITFSEVAGLTEPLSWSQRVGVKITATSCDSKSTMDGFSSAVTEGNWESDVENGDITSIGLHKLKDELLIYKPFTDRKAPAFEGDAPQFEVGSTSVDMLVQLDREGTIYYVVAPVGDIVTTISTQSGKDAAIWNHVHSGGGDDSLADYDVTAPEDDTIIDQKFAFKEIKRDVVKYQSGAGTMETIEVEDLIPETQYYAYFVLKGEGQTFSPVYLYKFETLPVDTPAITLSNYSPEVGFETHIESNLYYVLVDESGNLGMLTETLKLADGKTLPSQYMEGDEVKVSVLDALKVRIATTSNTGENIYRTLFDLYASDDQKQDLMEYITTTAAGTSGGRTFQILNMEPQTQERMDDHVENMTIGTYYYIISTAIHPLKDNPNEAAIQFYGFSALEDVHNPDDIPPEYISDYILRAGNMEVWSEKEQKGTQYKQYSSTAAATLRNLYFTGTVTFEFSEELYQVVDEGKYVRKFVACTTSEDTAEEDFVQLTDILGGMNDKFKPYRDTKPAPSTSFTLAFEDLRDGDSITLFSSGRIGDAHQGISDKKLTLTFDPAIHSWEYTSNKAPSGYVTEYIPGFRVKWE